MTKVAGKVLRNEAFESRVSDSYKIKVIERMPLLSHLRRWFLSEGIHDCSKFLGADGSISILVKQGECFSEFCCLFLCQMVCHYFPGPCLKRVSDSEFCINNQNM